MRRRDLLRSAVFAGAGITAAPFLNRGRYAMFAGTREYRARTIDLVSSCLVVDMLGLLTLDWQRLERWHTEPDSFSQADFDKLRTSGVTVFHPAVELNREDCWNAAVECFTRWNAFLENRPAEFLRISEIADMHRLKAAGKIGVLLGMQDSDHFRSPVDVTFFHDLGQRVSQLTYNRRNAIGCGCSATPDTGLTAFGAEIVGAMNAAGMAIDVSHAGERTTLDAIAASTRPVLITHSNCHALVPHPRCKSDAVIKAMAARGSVMGLTGISVFVSRRESANLQDLLDHYDHVARLVGPEHIGIGSDSDPDGRDSGTQRSRWRVPLEIGGVNHSRRAFDLTQGLINRGYSNSDIRLILGENVTRVLNNIFVSAPSQLVPSNI